MKHLEKKYLEYKEHHLLRKLNTFDSKKTIDFTTSDYLNISSSENLEKSILEGFRKYGFGSKGSSVVCGYNSSTKEFEEIFAKFVNYPKAIFFNSGFMANLAIYSTLFTKEDTLFADKNIHASTIDGIKLSEAKLKRYKHQDFNHLAKIYDNNNFIVTEGIFSTTGTITSLIELAPFQNNRLIVDEAHSFGILGENGAGSINHYNLNYKNCPIAIFPLGKAFGGVGAIVCTTNEIAEYLLQFARNYIYTTALPPLILEASITQLENLTQANLQRQKLKENILYFNKLCEDNNLNLVSRDVSPIRSILINDNSLAIKLKNILDKNNISVSCFRYPTVPKNQPILRFSIHANNSFSEIDMVMNILNKGKYNE
ncbi:aminotransferase class I/II-fold pyridoxal phosphate-dependent enzyme [Francisella frigiditurris]|uniref:Aminotransferase class I and II family protein n=1 Tax=Francisella frigiditurris TaxID=1542390 RepID=A0A1J0KS34_9GAMM|nr:pyridoxal phosphate-dependent aminotransferase family protein [Francisella frigiditurris]APC96553.1 aminotransferase class I and II family protein [Francisella frigiditurris]